MASQDSSSGERSQTVLSPDCVSCGNELFAALFDRREKASSIAKKFLKEIYAQNKETGEYTLIEFVFLCGGFKCDIAKKMTKWGYADLVQHVTKQGQAVNNSTHPLLGKKSKVNTNTLSDFISELIIQSKDNLDIYDDYLIPNLSEFLRNAAQTGHNNLRYSATFCSMRLTTALINVETENQKLRDRYDEHLQDAIESRQESRTILMREKASKKIELYEKRLQKTKAIIKYLTKKNFLAAFRDVWQPIRYLSMQELVVWVHISPMYLNTLGKYIGQAMFDYSVVVRVAALKAVATGLEAIDVEDDNSEYEGFFMACLKRLMDRVLDVSEQIAVLAMELIGNILERFPSIELSPEDERNVANMVYVRQRKVAQAAGIVMRNQQQARKGSDFILWLARFHASNVQDFPALFRRGTVELLLSALPENCPELTDWKAMMDAAKNAGPDLHAVIVIIAALVDRLDSEEKKAASIILRKMTKVFLKPFVSLLASCEDLPTITVFLEIIQHMDVSILCDQDYTTDSASLIEQVARVARDYCDRFVLGSPCAGALERLAAAGNDDAKDAMVSVFSFGMAKLEENIDDSSELALKEVEASLCLLAEFGRVMPLAETIETRFLKILQDITGVVSLTPRQWKPMVRAYAIKALFYDYSWWLVKDAHSSVVQENGENKGDFLLAGITAFCESEAKSEEATKIIITVVLDLICTMDSDVIYNEVSKLFLTIAEYLEKNVLARKDDADVQEEYRPLVVSFFKLLLQRYMDPEMSAVFYRNFASMSKLMQQTVTDLHLFFCGSKDFYSRLYSVIFAGLKKVYVDMYPTGEDCELELPTQITELAKTSELICSWLTPDKKETKKDYEEKSDEMAERMTAIITSCIATSDTMAPFCEVLTPFADKLTDEHKKKMLKLVLKGFAGQSSPGVKKLVTRLRMKNTEVQKLKEISTSKDTEEVMPSPIEHRRLDGSRYTPLPLRNSRIPSSERRPNSNLPSVIEGSDSVSHRPIPEDVPQIQLSQSESSDNSDPALVPAESNDSVPLSAEIDDSMLDKQPPAGKDPGLARIRHKKPQGHSTLIEKEPNPKGQSCQPKPVPGPSSNKSQAVTSKDLPHHGVNRPRKLNYVPLPVQTVEVRKEGKKKINVPPSLEENADSIHEHPACSLAKYTSPEVVIAAKDCTDSSNNSSASGKPPEISSGEESCDKSLPRDEVLLKSAARARVTPPKLRSIPLPVQTVEVRKEGKKKINVPPTLEENADSIHEHPACSLAKNTSPEVVIAAKDCTDSSNNSSASGKPPEISSGEESCDKSLPRDEVLLESAARVRVTPRKLRSIPLPVQTVEVRKEGKKKINVPPTLEENADSIHEHPACSLAKNTSPEVVIAAKDCTDSSNNSSASGKPEISSGEESCDKSLPRDEVLLESGARVRVTPPKASSHQISDATNRSVDMSLSFENALTQKLSLKNRSQSQALNPFIEGWSVTANAGSFDRTSAQSNIAPQQKEGTDTTSKSSQESSLLDNGQSCRANSAIEEHELSPSSQQGSSSLKKVLGGTENADGNLLVSEDCEDDFQICSSQPHQAKSSDSLKLVKDAATIADECRSGTDSEDFIPSSQLCSISPDKKSPPEKTFDLEALISDDESNNEEFLQKMTLNSNEANEFANSPKDVMASSSPKVGEIEDMAAEDEKDDSAGHTRPTPENSNFIVAASPEISSEEDMRAKGSEENPVIMQNEQASENSDDARSIDDYPEEAVVTFSPQYVGTAEMPSEYDSDESKTASNHPYSESESDCGLDSSESEVPDSGQKALECLAGPSQETFRGPSHSLYLDCKENESQASCDSANQAAPQTVSSSCGVRSLGNNSQKSVESVGPPLVTTPLGSLMDDVECSGSDKSLVPEASSPPTSPSGSLMSRIASDGSENNLLAEAKSSEESPRNPMVRNINANASMKSPVVLTQSTVTSPLTSLTSDVEAGCFATSLPTVSKSPMSLRRLLISEIDSDESSQSQMSVAPSSVMSPPNSLMNDIESDSSMNSRASKAPSSVMSPPNSLMKYVESDSSMNSRASKAPSSVMSPTNSLMNDIESDSSMNSRVSKTPSSVMSPPNSLMNDIESDSSMNSRASKAPSSVMSPPNSLMNDIESDSSMISRASKAPSSVMSPPNSLMNDIESDSSMNSRASKAPSSVMSPPNSLMNDIESDDSVNSQIFKAPSSVMSPTNSLMNDIESDSSVNSRTSKAPSSVMSPPNSLMNDIESDDSVNYQIFKAPSSVTSPPDSLISGIESDISVKSQVSVGPYCVSSPPESLMDDVEEEDSVQSPLSVAPTDSPTDSLMSDVV